MNQSEEIIDVEATPASAWDVFIFNWGEETLKRNIPLQNEVLRLLLTLSAGLLAGSAPVLQGRVTKLFFGGTTGCFLIALAVSLLGVLPYNGGGIRMNSPNALWAHKERAMQWKQRFLWATAIALLLGFLIAIVGILIGVPN